MELIVDYVVTAPKQYQILIKPSIFFRGLSGIVRHKNEFIQSSKSFEIDPCCQPFPLKGTKRLLSWLKTTQLMIKEQMYLTTKARILNHCPLLLKNIWKQKIYLKLFTVEFNSIYFNKLVNNLIVCVCTPICVHTPILLIWMSCTSSNFSKNQFLLNWQVYEDNIICNIFLLSF